MVGVTVRWMSVIRVAAIALRSVWAFSAPNRALRALVALLLVGRPLSSSNLILSMYAWRAALVNTSCLFASNTMAQEGYWRDKSAKFSFHMNNSPFMSFFCVTGSSWLPVNG